MPYFDPFAANWVAGDFSTPRASPRWEAVNKKGDSHAKDGLLPLSNLSRSRRRLDDATTSLGT
jgi:hypothetical protein